MRAGLPEEFREDVEQALLEIPSLVRQRLEDKLAGIYFAVDFGGTGFTDAVSAPDGRENVGFVVLDSTILSLRTANAWATWKENGATRYVSLFDEHFPLREHVVYYFGARLSLGQAFDVYDALGATTFPTLYAATSPGDDWAEGFASYVHTVMMRRPFRIRIYRTGQLLEDFGPCWEEPRCAGKRRIIERFLGLGG